MGGAVAARRLETPMGYIVRYIAARLAFQALQRVGVWNLFVAVGFVAVAVFLFLALHWKG
jgi:hypothetical protein